MNQVTTIGQDNLPQLIDRAAAALTGARSSAEVLEARDMARVAYDAAKSAGRMARAKSAHDEVIAAVYRAQADAAVIEARAKVRLADEYDAAQKRGEVVGAHDGARNRVGGDNAIPTAADLGLRRDEIHDARRLRDAEAAAPGKIEEAANALVARGEEPTKATLRREVMGASDEAGQSRATGPDAKARRELAKLTPAALIDEVIVLREALAESKANTRRVTAERDDLKQRLADHTADDKDEVIRRMTAAVKNAENAKWRATEEQGRQQREIYALKKRIEELQSMGVAI